MRRDAPKWGAPAVADQSNCPEGTTVAAREARIRVESVAAVTSAMTVGDWPIDVESLDLLGDILAAASRWQLVDELAAA